MPGTLVLVESPAKSRKLASYLPGMIVESTIGHFRDLPRRKTDLPEHLQSKPWAHLGINLDEDFKPIYLISSEKTGHVAKLRRLAQEADRVILATDDDREGEGISAHIVEEFRLPAHKYTRAVFHEITKDAVQHAINNPRDLDTDLVQAQETRRVLDRLYGYEVSAALGKNARGLTAGRVQSAAVKLIVLRELKRVDHVKAAYTTVTVTLDCQPAIAATSATLNGTRLATGKDFDAETGNLKTNALILTPEQAGAFVRELKTGELTVTGVQEKPFKETPPAPFTTSTLQQEASRKLKFTPAHTMALAQTLYEQGFITYMRTDSTVLSDEAQAAARAHAVAAYGPATVPATARQFSAAAGAQAAHEAIRPSGSTWKDPKVTMQDIRGALKNGDDAAALYDLIFKRTVASQMTDHLGTHATVHLEFSGRGGTLGFITTGKTTTQPGWTQGYALGEDEPEEDADPTAAKLPPLKTGDQLDVTSAKANAKKTAPPTRYTEASLVAALESEGVGRPSTYAAILAKIHDAGYTRKKGMALVPTYRALASHALMERDFTTLVDISFTASMETELDRIASGQASRVTHLQQFYTTLQDVLTQARSNTAPLTVPHKHAQTAGVTLSMDGEGRGMLTDPQGRSTVIPDAVAPDELTPEKIQELLANPVTPTASASSGKPVGACPRTGLPITLKTGKHGPYLHRAGGGEEPEKNASLPKGEDEARLDARRAGLILDVRRTVGEGTPHETTIQFGQFGPYASRTVGGKRVNKTLSVPKALTITAEELDALYR